MQARERGHWRGIASSLAGELTPTLTLPLKGEGMLAGRATGCVRRFGSTGCDAQPRRWWGWSTRCCSVCRTSGWCKGPPSARRRFLDILISQADPLYLQGLQRYQRVLQQRNRLLRMRREGRARPDEMEFWDDELVREGAWLTWRRHEVMNILTPACVRHHRDLGGEGETLELRYRPSVPLAADPSGMPESYREALQVVAGRERATAATAAGPHRDDFDIIVNGVDMSAFASRGQARTLALSLRLAEAETLSAVRGAQPLLLLDDALSEMDADRRRRVLEKTANYPQVMITTTDVEQVSGFFGASAAYFRVEGGRITPVELFDAKTQRRKDAKD